MISETTIRSNLAVAYMESGLKWYMYLFIPVAKNHSIVIWNELEISLCNPSVKSNYYSHTTNTHSHSASQNILRLYKYVRVGLTCNNLLSGQ